jgi:DNA/RNA-binding domain of Phe-tRNA-synthetase-like protein
VDGLIETGAVAPAIAGEFPALGVLWLDVAAAPSRTPPDIRARLAHLSDRWRGAQAVALRRQPVAHAHRVFFRHVGIDPDVQRVPQEEIIVRRLLDGGFRPRGLPADALTIACVETGIGVWALDAAAVDGALAIAFDDTHRIAVGDATGPLATLFGAPDARAAVTKATRAMRLYAIRAPGVPEVFVREALELAAELLDPLSD